MPTPTYPIPQTLSVLQLYRHLLRECSYLPPAFRNVVTKTIQSSFHKHRLHDDRRRAHIARAKTTLRNLRAANSGDKSAMDSLISKGFGRSGSRRRELMAQFVLPQGPSDSNKLEALLDPSSEGGAAQAMPDGALSKKAFYEKWDQPKLLKVLRSQKQQQNVTKGTMSWRGKTVGVLDSDFFIPSKTIWNRPPSEMLKRAKRSAWWRRSADKMMPPLGKGEWDLLRALSKGGQETDEWAVPERRSHINKTSYTKVMGSQWQEYATKPAAVVERPKSLTNQRRSGQKDDNPYGVGDRGRDLSPRWFQRAYQRTWQLTPTMEQDPGTLRHSISWGRAGSKLPQATKLQSVVFEGVDEKGRPLVPAR